MKRFLMTRFMVLAAALVFVLPKPAVSKTGKVSFIKNGAYVEKINSYTLDGNLYINASRLAKLLSGKIYWYPVSGKLFFQVKGKKVVFRRDEDEVIINDKKVSMPHPYIVRGGRAFILKDFLVSKNFASAFGFKLDYNQKTRVLEEKHNINVTSVNYFSYKDRTRIVIYMTSKLDYQASQKENKFLNISVFGAAAYSDDKMNINDGVVKSFSLKQENKYARIGVELDENFKDFKIFTLKSPDRIVIDLNSVYSNETKEKAEAIAPTAAIMAETPSGSEPVISISTAESSEDKISDDFKINIPDEMTLNDGKVKTIVIDPGHGGKDPGGRKIFGLKEKDINLRVGKLLYRKLKKVKGFRVLMTRVSDVFIPLRERSKIANDNKAALFISIHANASRSRKERGFEIYFMSEKASDPWAAEVADFENSAIRFEKSEKPQNQAALLLHSLARNEYMNEGAKLAGFVGREYEKRTPFVFRGVKQAAFYVLRGTYAPGILVETGFMTNRRDQSNLCSLKIRKKIADAIYRGIMNYAKTKGWK